MKRMKNKLIILAGAVIMSTTGCNKVLSHEEKAIQLLNAKYNDSFEVEECQSKNSFEEYYTVIAYQKNNPDILFKAEVDYDGKKVSDNYVSKILCRKISDQIAKNLDDLKGIYYIYSEPMVELTVLDDTDITVEKYMEISPLNKFIVYLNYCPEGDDAEDIFLALQGAFKDMECISGQIQLYIVDENMLMQIQNYLENNDALYDEYHSATEQYKAGNIKVENGKIIASKEEIEKILESRL